MNATAKQKRIVHALLAKRGLMDMKAELVMVHTSGRTKHSSEMTRQEIARLINTLQDGFADQKPFEADRRMRRRILSLCYSLGWTRADQTQQKMVLDTDRLDAWMVKYSYKHKPLADYRHHELPLLVTQFEKFVKSTLV